MPGRGTLRKLPACTRCGNSLRYLRKAEAYDGLPAIAAYACGTCLDISLRIVRTPARRAARVGERAPAERNGSLGPFEWPVIFG